MPFTGAPVVTEITDGLFLITGVALALSASGTISLSGGTGEAKMTAPNWGAEGTKTIGQQTQVITNRTTAVPATATPLRVVKSGTTPTDFLITVTNDDGAAASGSLEIYVRFH